MKTTSIFNMIFAAAALMASALSHAETLSFIPAAPTRIESVRVRVDGPAIRYDATSVKVSMAGNKITVSAQLLYSIPTIVALDIYRRVPFDVELGRLPSGTYDVEFVGNRTEGGPATSLGASRLVVAELNSTYAFAPMYDYTDIWWNPEESGWGISIHVKNRNLFAAWFVYDSMGRPTWYTIQGCGWSKPDTCELGTVVKATGTPLGGILGLSAIVMSSAGVGSIRFNGYDSATMLYTVDGISSQKTITRQLF